MLKLKIYSIGKTKEKWLEEAIGEYLKRMQANVKISYFWAKDNLQLIEWVTKEKNVVCLDPTGKLMTSEEFSEFFAWSWEKSGSNFSIVIGGAMGIPLELKKNNFLLSLSPLTFTHQMTQLILIEQIYRAIEIQKGSRYHKA